MSDGTNGGPAISLRGLRKVYRTGLLMRRRVALEQLDLDVPAGSIFGFIGHNGAGKTTSIKLMMGLARPSAGDGTLLGRPLGHLHSLAEVGFLPERPYFYDYLTGREFLDFYARLFDLPRDVRRQRAERLLEQVGLASSGDVQLRTYSKGMLQRIGVAQALINDPKLVVLDEPMSGLDPAGRTLIRNVILSMQADGRTVFFSSHILSDVELICERIGILVHGRLHYTGGVEELLQRHSDRVELRVEDIPDAALTRVREDAAEVTEVGGQWLIQVADGDPAQAMLARLTDSGARVVAVTPLRPSLEDLFVRELAGTTPPAEEEAPAP
jgi:ABC-2 type transport system ATP-binding protein